MRYTVFRCSPCALPFETRVHAPNLKSRFRRTRLRRRQLQADIPNSCSRRSSSIIEAHHDRIALKFSSESRRLRTPCCPTKPTRFKVAAETIRRSVRADRPASRFRNTRQIHREPHPLGAGRRKNLGEHRRFFCRSPSSTPSLKTAIRLLLLRETPLERRAREHAPAVSRARKADRKRDERDR